MRGRRRPAGTFDHRDWLHLVDMDGPFLSVPELKRVYKQGFTTTMTPADLAAFRLDKAEFEKVWDAWQRHDKSLDAVRAARDEWVDHVLRRVFGWGNHLVPDDSVQVQSPDLRVSATSTFAFRRGDTRSALVWVVDPVESLRSAGADGWAADQIDRMELLLREAKVPVGVVTDGRWWAMVSAPTGKSVASGITDAQTWVEDAQVRDAFAELLSPKRLAGGAAEDRLAAMFEKSVASAEEVTEALGSQVRRAVELLVQAFSESAVEAQALGEPNPLPEDGDEIYAAVVATMMRMVFLLFAEERNLLPQGELFSEAYGLTGQREELQRRAEQDTHESLESTWSVWHRLQATAKALSEGASFEDMRLPAYGGSLFSQEKFPFLTAVTSRGTLALRVNDRVMMHVLDALQMTDIKGQGKRPISFRDIDVEQIGYIYEGLLGYTCDFAQDTIVGLISSKAGEGSEPEIPLGVLHEMAEQHTTDKALATAILAWVKTNQPSAIPPSATALAKALAASDSPTAEDELALRALTTDEDLQDELRTWLGAIRRDLRDRPTVFFAGGLYVKETPSRKNAGAHYTPRDLAEEVVLHALEPLVYQPGPHQTADHSQWQLKSPEEILGLKVVDIACGSGAFLVAAGRYLADKLVEAWAESGRGIGSPEQQHLTALREVVAKCLYGVDINEMAIEMCKLSLWLVSLDPKKPFSFVDDKLLVGNSLLGITDLAQLRALHIDPAKAPSEHLFDTTESGYEAVADVASTIHTAIRIRAELDSTIDNDDPMRSARAKEDQWRRYQRTTAKLTDIADGIIAAGLELGGKPGKALDNAYADLRIAVNRAYDPAGDHDRTTLEAIQRRGLTPTVVTDYDRWQCLHWPITFADVMDTGGFDAVVGNPPFLGGKKISNASGKNVREFFVNQIAHGMPGNADLVAYFFIRAYNLLKSEGQLGLIATNTVAQGDTREVGLDQLDSLGMKIHRSIRSRNWPSGASLQFAAVWATNKPWHGNYVVDGEPASGISPLLEPLGRHSGNPSKLIENSNQAFIGCNPNGTGFRVPAPVAQAWLQRQARPTVIHPTWNGSELNDAYDLDRANDWIINFKQMQQSEAEQYGAEWQWLKKNVENYRQSLTNKPKLREYWWRFEAPATKLLQRCEQLDTVICLARTSKTQIPTIMPAANVYDSAVVVFATSSMARLAMLTSNMHWLWTLTRSSGMKSDTRYSPTDVYMTFPFPTATPRLKDLGFALHNERRMIMLRRELGLTKLYNLVNDETVADSADPDIARLRQIHVELDEAVMAAYGWDDVPLDHGFHTYRQMTRWTVSPAARVEILDRLLEENHRRAATQGSTPTPAPEDDEEMDA